MSEKTYTLTEATEEIERQECRNGGHVPNRGAYSASGYPVSWWCACGEFRYEPHQREKKS